MRKQMPDFANSTTPTTDSWYDLREDWSLVEASIASQYGIRIRQASDMPWSEFTSLITGLLPETPLGAVIKIRSENDPDMLKRFNKDQLEIRNKWRDKQAFKQLDNPEVLKQSMDNLSKMLKDMFGDNVEVV